MTKARRKQKGGVPRTPPAAEAQKAALRRIRTPEKQHLSAGLMRFLKVEGAFPFPP